MKKEKIFHVMIVTFFIVLIMPIMSVRADSATSPLSNTFKSAELDTLEDNPEILNVQSCISKNPFSQDFSIFGYRLKIDDSQPIIRDENGLLILYQDKTNIVDVTLKLKWNNFEFKNIPLFGTLYSNKDGCKNFYYQIEDPLKGFFMTVIIAAEMTYIDLAFNDEISQYCYNGLVSKGYMSFNPYFTQQIEIVQVILEKNTQAISIDKGIQTLKDFQSSSISIYQNEENERTLTTLGISYTKYGIAHECADESTVNLAEDLPDYYWEPYTEINYGIYRREPTENQVKSDLQYYNRDIYGKYIRDIKAYAVYAHSEPGRNTQWLIRRYKVWDWWPFIYHWVYEWLTPSEVASLWYYSWDPGTGDEIYVYPTDMIIHATVCYGYSGNDGIPHMARAFVDYGAAAYVGATVGIPTLHNDEFTEAFWYDLCQDDRTVDQATRRYITTHNYYYDYPEGLNIRWVYGTHIKIYGSTSVRLDN